MIPYLIQMNLKSFIAILLTTLISYSYFGTEHSAVRNVRFQKRVLDREFRSEGVAVADVNRDGRADVMAGNLWYEAPKWTPHEIAPVLKFDAAKSYSNSFVNFTADINRDGWPDQIRIDWPGKEPAFWHENPKGKDGHWPKHLLFRNACNESPAFARLNHASKDSVLVFSLDDSQMAWYESDKNVTAPFVAHPISDKIEGDSAKTHGVFRYSHGLGIGDLNGDRRPDVITTSGYWEAPKDPRSGPWKFVKANLGQDCAQMQVYDVNGDGLNDVITSSAHKIGVWWHQQRKGADGKPEFVEHLIDNSFSQSHSLELADINGDGLKDFVTGKRYWAHGPTGDVNASEPPMLFWFELKREKGEVKWIKHEIDNDSGVGTQFTIADINGDKLPDIVTANKRGVFVFVQML